ncbi:hypothetical protein ABN226_18660, partial [Morganella morganii]|uniref:hypothetical protein n=1 Tax=Morganella morganii TaxID=582 RepID=UPI0032DA1C83
MMKKIDPSYTHEPNSFPNSHPNTYYSPSSQVYQENNTKPFFKTPLSNPFPTHINPYDYIPPAKNEIEILKEKIEVFTRMAQEDTTNLKAEIRSELKDYLATLREEGLPLEEIETKMLAMIEEFMRTSSLRIDYPLVENLPISEANPRIKAQDAGKEVDSEGMVDCYAPVLEEVPIFELENQKKVEIESE